MIKIEHQNSYYFNEFENILDFDSNLDNIFDWIYKMDDFLQTVSSKVTVYHASFKFVCIRA